MLLPIELFLQENTKKYRMRGHVRRVPSTRHREELGQTSQISGAVDISSSTMPLHHRAFSLRQPMKFLESRDRSIFFPIKFHSKPSSPPNLSMDPPSSPPLPPSKIRRSCRRWIKDWPNGTIQVSLRPFPRETIGGQSKWSGVEPGTDGSWTYC